MNTKKYLPQIVYGGSDGVVSYFSLMAAAYGAGMSVNILIAIGISNVVADAFSMASADYLSEDSVKDSDFKKELTGSFFTFTSFVVTGLFPLIPTLYQYVTTDPTKPLLLPIFILSILFTILVVTFIGYLRGKVLKRNIAKTIIQQIFVCTLSSLAAFFIGEYLAKVLI